MGTKKASPTKKDRPVMPRDEELKLHYYSRLMELRRSICKALDTPLPGKAKHILKGALSEDELWSRVPK